MNAPAYRQYKTSGKVSWRAPLLVLTVALPISALCAGIYALVVRYNPFIYFTVLASLAFGACVGLVAQMTAEKGNSRNRRFDVAASLCAAIFALWVHWLVWIALRRTEGLEVAMRMATSGVHSWLMFFDDLSSRRLLSITRGGARGALSPTTMVILWIVEALLVSLAAMGAAFVCHGKQAFSERTGKWSKTDAQAALYFNHGNFSDVLASINEHGLGWLNGLPLDSDPHPRAVDGWNILNVECVSEPSDPEFRFVTITGATTKPRPKGRPVTQHKADICTLLHAEPSAYESLVVRLTQQ
ncbi:MAG: hypothetical protein SF187_23515 [Deltaproteobacteria bacterium]|nr:hypothetical protein [Deltaproteobacteria bacterium]